jgi:glycosyltransferase involved in cell wall biosynthesis
MKVLYIAPLPPPTTGHALASQILLEELMKSHVVDVVNLSRDRSVPRFSPRRIRCIAKSYWHIWRSYKKVDAIYFTISESVAGNIKDLVIYLICVRRLARMLIHLHGGAGMMGIMARKGSLLYKLNSLALRRLGGVIVLGASHTGIYSDTVPAHKIHVVPNCAEDYLFASKEEILRKFSVESPLRLLFLSNFLPGKGFKELVQAYQDLDDSSRQKVQLDFAGEFRSNQEKTTFLKVIQADGGIRYYGSVSGAAKRDCFSHAHVFCLPTYYPYEGQPISILEAYASGCVVVTTNHSGIRDIFADNVNGYQVEQRSSDSITRAIVHMLGHMDDLRAIALANRESAFARYRTSIYTASLRRVVEQTGSKSQE